MFLNPKYVFISYAIFINTHIMSVTCISCE